MAIPITKDSTDESYINSGASYISFPLSRRTHLSEVREAHCDVSSGMVYGYDSGTLQVASLVSGRECEADL